MSREAEIRKYLAANFPQVKLRKNMNYRQLLRIAQQQAGTVPTTFSTEGLTEGRNPSSEAAEAIAEDLPTKEEAVPSGGADGQVLTKLSGGDYDMGWRTPSATGGGSGSVTSVGIINGGGLTVSGSPITSDGSITLTLENSGVSAGSYTAANISVDNYGRVTAAANGAAPVFSGSIANGQIAVGTGADAIGGSGNFNFFSNAMTITTGDASSPKIQMAYDTGALTMQVTNPNELQLSDGSDDGSGAGTALRFSSGVYSAVTNPGFGQVKLSANHTTKTGGFNAGILQLTTENGYLRFGPQNGSFCHFYTDRTYFYFNKPIQFDGGAFYAYNDDLTIKTDDASTGQPTRIFIDAQVDECRIGLGNGFDAGNLPATECHVNGTIRQTAVTSKLLRADANGDLAAVTIGTNLAFDGTTLAANPVSIRDEGVGVGVVDTIDFQGAGVTATLDGTSAIVTIPGGGGGGGGGPDVHMLTTTHPATCAQAGSTITTTGNQHQIAYVHGDDASPITISTPTADGVRLTIFNLTGLAGSAEMSLITFADPFLDITAGMIPPGGAMGQLKDFGVISIIYKANSIVNPLDDPAAPAVSGWHYENGMNIRSPEIRPFEFA